LPSAYAAISRSMSAGPSRIWAWRSQRASIAFPSLAPRPSSLVIPTRDSTRRSDRLVAIRGGVLVDEGRPRACVTHACHELSGVQRMGSGAATSESAFWSSRFVSATRSLRISITSSPEPVVPWVSRRASSSRAAHHGDRGEVEGRLPHRPARV